MKKTTLRPFHLNDLVRDKIPGQLSASADGVVAMTIAEALPDLSRRTSRVWLLDETSPDGAHPVTAEGKNASSPRTSPDGRHFAYLAERDDHTAQVVVLSKPFSEPRAVTCFAHGVRLFSWFPDGKTLLVLASADLPPAKKKALDRKDDARDVEADEPKARMWIVTIDGQKPRPLGPGNLHVRNAVVSPDGRRIAFVASPHPRPGLSARRCELRVLNLGSNSTRFLRKISSGGGADTQPSWSPDGNSIAFDDAPRVGQLGPDYVFAMDVATRRSVRIDRAADRVSYLPRWLDNDTLVFLQQRGVRRVLRVAPASGRPGRSIVDLPGYVYDYTISPDGKKAFFTYSENDKPAEVFSISAPWPAKPQRLTRVNQPLLPVRHVKGEVVRWKSSEGWDVEGLFWRPPRRVRPPYATVVIPHGGPHFVASNAHDPLSQALCSAGYAVFLPNFRGSTGYSEKFFRAIHSDWARGPADDILRGVKSLTAKRLADPKRLVLLGGSFGGYMTAWLIGHSKIFRAAVAHAPVVNNVSMWGTTDIPDFMEWSFKGNPFTSFKDFWDASPVKHLARCTTPTLVLVGEKDVRVPIGQAQELYQTLRTAGAKTALVVFPREGHGIGEPLHWIDYVRRSLDWFKSHLGRSAPSAK